MYSTRNTNTLMTFPSLKKTTPATTTRVKPKKKAISLCEARKASVWIFRFHRSLLLSALCVCVPTTERALWRTLAHVCLESTSTDAR